MSYFRKLDNDMNLSCKKKYSYKENDFFFNSAQNEIAY